jgi:hypothetical protein
MNKERHSFSQNDSEILLENEEGTFFETMVPRTMERTPLLPEQDEILRQKSMSDDSDGRDPVSENDKQESGVVIVSEEQMHLTLFFLVNDTDLGSD